jgi:integrative and conjugative element protein (TIGR02256 family)
VPVALETFTAPYAFGVDGFTEIAKGEFIIEGHELVRQHPDKFAPGSTARRSGTSSHEAWRGIARPPVSRRAAGMPELRHRPHHTVAISRAAWDAIGREIGDGLESGGVLLGERAPDGSFLISDASGPGEGAARTSHAIRHDLDRYRRIAACSERAGLRMLGIWHEHPGGSAEPSETDLRSWNAAAELADDGMFLGVIVRTDLDDPNPYTCSSVYAWTCGGGVVEPATVFTNRWEIPE